ncbi:hypothetical protein V9T40_013422 [Parthenolecanium corni]|uniref:DUF5641 domain-containing protein n=1 Tax=Parthenolecanium corni TaxID=536013 RepID=A0AAN9XX32_9HEMI
MHSRASDDDDDETSAGGYVAHRRRLRAATPKTRTTFAVDRRPRPERSAGYIARRSSALRESGVRARARCVKISSSPAAVDDRESAYALRGCLRPRQRFRSTFVFETYVALTPGEYGYSRGFGGVRSSHSTACRSPETRTPYEYGRAAGPLASTDGFRSFGRSGEYATRALSRAPVGLAVPSLPRDTTRRTRVLTARSPLRDGEFEAGRNAAHDERTRDEGGYRTGRAIPGVSGIAARTLARVLERRSLQRRRIGAATRPTRSARETSPPTRPRGTKSTGDARPQNSIARDHSQRARPSPTGKTDTRTLQYTETTPRRTQLGRRGSKSTFVDAERLSLHSTLISSVILDTRNFLSFYANISEPCGRSGRTISHIEARSLANTIRIRLLRLAVRRSVRGIGGSLVCVFELSPGYRQLLWTIWTEQYLLALRESKNIVSSRRATLKQPLEGDVVLMVDPSLRRGFWRTAIIDRLIRSGDGQKPRRNDGSTMSTTSPSSGCFSVALLLLTIFLDSLRASKYCSVQIKEKKKKKRIKDERRREREYDERERTSRRRRSRVGDRRASSLRSTPGVYKRRRRRRRRHHATSYATEVLSSRQDEPPSEGHPHADARSVHCDFVFRPLDRRAPRERDSPPTIRRKRRVLGPTTRADPSNYFIAYSTMDGDSSDERMIVDLGHGRRPRATPASDGFSPERLRP